MIFNCTLGTGEMVQWVCVAECSSITQAYETLYCESWNMEREKAENGLENRK